MDYKEAFQARVHPWMLACFGAAIAADAVERNHRFFEEAAELVQSCGMTASEAHQLVDYTWSRPIGETHQEVGGVMVTLAALCLAQGLDMHAAGETELARISDPSMMAKIRAKQTAKPKHSPLPYAPAVPDKVRQAVERMCTPLHESRLSGETAKADARCMKIIRDYVLGGAAPAVAPASVRDDWQQKALDHGFQYWRASDAHGVQATKEQAVDLLQSLLGVEVEISEPKKTDDELMAWANRVSCNKYAEEMDAIRKSLGLEEDCDYGEIIEAIEALREDSAPAQAEQQGAQHKWDDEGDHCTRCGDPAWCADAVCKPRAEQQADGGARGRYEYRDTGPIETGEPT